MKNGQFRIIVAAMSISLAGLIFLQVYWIKHDFESKAKQFDGTVMLAMNKIVAQVEETENMRMVLNHFISVEDSNTTYFGLNDSLMHVLSEIAMAPAPPPPPLPPGSHQNLKEELNAKIANGKNLESQWTPQEDLPLLGLDSTIDIRIEKNFEQKEIIDLRIHNRKSKIHSFEKADEQIKRIDDKKLEIVEKRMQSKMKKLNSIVQKLTFQIVDPNATIFSRINQRSLDSIVLSEVKNHDLNLDFSYGVLQRKNPEILYLSKSADTNKVLHSNYQLGLFPNDIIKRNEILVIEFSDKFNYIVGSMLMLLIFSLLFTGIIIAGFAYTIHVILRQKKLAIVKNDFINNMTHEFKTPIATIAIANETIRDPRINQSAEKLDFYTGIIRDENERMLRQVETVLQMAQIDKGEIKINKENIELKDVLDSAAGSMQLGVEQKGGNIQLNWHCDDVKIFADPNHLLNVFTNLLDNATKYSKEIPEISIDVKLDNSIVNIAIEDHGIGMSKEVTKKVFDTFYRATSGNIHDVKGFGLGLSYVKAIIDMHEGSIDVTSELGKGSTFTIRLPIIKNEEHEG